MMLRRWMTRGLKTRLCFSHKVWLDDVTSSPMRDDEAEEVGPWVVVVCAVDAGRIVDILLVVYSFPMYKMNAAKGTRASYRRFV